MASSINASTSGAGGVITTADNSGILNLQSGGTTIATVQSTGFSLPTTSTINAANTFDFKNRIINGGMTIDQRNAGAAITAGGYNVDRWRVDATSFGQAYSIQQNKNSVTPPAGFTSYVGIQFPTAVNPGGNNTMLFDQLIEGYSIADLAWGTANAKTVTVSAWVYSSLTGTFSGALSVNGYSYIFTYSIPVANTWTQISTIIPGPTSVSPASTTNGAGCQLIFSLGASGSYSNSTTGSWISGNYYGTPSSVLVYATTNATFYLTGVQLEVGSQATSFDFRDYGREFIMCQRYYQGSQQYYGTKSVSAYTRQNAVYPVLMRTTSTAVFSDLANNLSKISVFAANDARTDNIGVVAFSGGTYGFQVLFNNGESQPGYGFNASFSAEL